MKKLSPAQTAALAALVEHGRIGVTTWGNRTLGHTPVPMRRLDRLVELGLATRVRKEFTWHYMPTDAGRAALVPDKQLTGVLPRFKSRGEA
jgi:DNA-binding MarR family transcriptional regulator